MRMSIRLFTRLTNAFSKKWENHWAALALYFAFYNFCRIHSSIRVTPAMQAGITDHVWEFRNYWPNAVPSAYPAVPLFIPGIQNLMAITTMEEVHWNARNI
jgi:hypothetical protein